MATPGSTTGEAWLLQTLQASLEETDATARKHAEESLGGASLQAGYGVTLCKIALNPAVAIGVRQLASVLLKQYAKHHWQEEEEGYVPPTALPEDKALIRDLLLQGLGEPEPKIRTGIAVAVATIAGYDWPQDWPALMQHLLAAMNDRGNPNRVAGGLRCLALFSDDLEDSQVPQLLPLLVPALYHIAADHQGYDAALRARALHVLKSCLSTLAVMSGAFQEETRKLVVPMLPPWMHLFAAILGQPLMHGQPEDWGLRLEVFRCLMQVVQHFGPAADGLLPVVLPSLWQSYVGGIAVYQRAAVEGEEETYTGRTDEDGGSQSLEALSVQAFEFILTLMGNSRHKVYLKDGTEPLIYFAMAYMQMTEEQVAAWGSDPNQFVSDEDNEALSVRTSACMLLESLVDAFGPLALKGLAVAAQRRLQEAALLKSDGRSHWWKLREATILAVGTVADSLESNDEEESGGPDAEWRSILDPVQFVEKVLLEDTSASATSWPFLQGRAFWAVAKFSGLLTQDIAAKFLQAAAQGLSSESEPAVQVGACRAMAQLCPRAPKEVLRVALPSVYPSLGAYLGKVDDELLHLALEALEAVIKSDDEFILPLESQVTPTLFTIWAENITDPVVSEDAADVIEAIADSAGCLEPLMQRAVPMLAGIMAKPDEQSPGLVAGGLDLLTHLLQRSPPDLVKLCHDQVFTHVIAIVLKSDDNSELQSGAECLAAFVRRGGQPLLLWASNPSQSMKMLLDAAARLLDPALPGSASLLVGEYVTQLIRHMPEQMAPHLRPLVEALARRMQGQAPSLKAAILLVFARLVHMSAPNVGQLLEMLDAIPVEGRSSALHVVLEEWAECEGDISGAYKRKVSTTALATLLASGDPRLAKVTVKGRLIQTPLEGIVTRSRARNKPQEWTKTSFPAKVLSLLAGVLLEQQEVAAGRGEDDDDEWEDYEGRGEEDADGGTPSAEGPLEGGGLSAPPPTPGMQAKAAAEMAASEILRALMNTEDLEDGSDGFEGDDADAAEDPINQINLPEYIAQYLGQLASSHREGFEALARELTIGERKAVEAAVLASTISR
eukprot:TRINITY_DN471_c0_g1_i1.p1 TRINITY_DN471_c0_g1~~TRINITY_DN471_c0_g1_i1.p1  ORF type:complete len:1065 (+),score=246.85 TRINITY_DN471_c0_g1_i1:95-3289(+)